MVKYICTLNKKDLCDFIASADELAPMISHDLEANVESSPYVQQFAAYMVQVRNQIVAIYGPIKHGLEHKESWADEITLLFRVFFHLLTVLDNCLVKYEMEHLTGSSSCLLFINELHSISKLYHGPDEVFWNIIMRTKDAVSRSIATYANTNEDYKCMPWILQVMNAANFETNIETRRYLAAIMLPQVNDDDGSDDDDDDDDGSDDDDDDDDDDGSDDDDDDDDRIFLMRIDRSDLLALSFYRMGFAEPKLLRACSLRVRFKNELAYGVGVRREWFLLVCQEIFSPETNLFVACPDDRRRFYPSAASKVDPLHLEYFSFAGRVIALALMHKVHVGIALDRVFFLQLAGRGISLEDVQDADPYIYSSCKQILEMDPDTVDQDALGLTFSYEIEEFGERKTVELCPGGSQIVMDSKNRELYVDSLIQYLFVTAISEQVASFAKGFDDIMSYQSLRKCFFRCLDLGDLDLMLHGSESEISVDDWKVHTDYDGFKKTDIQISWFWKIVGSMSSEQKKALLFFWTSVKYLPFEGFSGLNSRLSITKAYKKSNYLPFSSTCFYELYLPAYDSFDAMRNCLRVVTQEHIHFSFGTE